MADKPTLQVKGNVDLEKYKAAKTLAGDDVKFELRAMRHAPGSAARSQPSCLVCIICIICIVCTVANAAAAGTKLPPL